METALAAKLRSRPWPLAARLLLMVLLVLLLIVGSEAPRRLPVGRTLTIWVNILFFVVLGAADEWVLAAALNRWPLARAAVLIGETLALGWFFSPGRLKPASKILFFAHIGPFFVAVFAGALAVLLARHWRTRAR